MDRPNLIRYSKTVEFVKLQYGQNANFIFSLQFRRLFSLQFRFRPKPTSTPLLEVRFGTAADLPVSDSRPAVAGSNYQAVLRLIWITKFGMHASHPPAENSLLLYYNGRFLCLAGIRLLLFSRINYANKGGPNGKAKRRFPATVYLYINNYCSNSIFWGSGERCVHEI